MPANVRKADTADSRHRAAVLSGQRGGRAAGEQLSHRGMVVVQDQEALDGPLPHLREDLPPCTQRMVI